MKRVKLLKLLYVHVPADRKARVKLMKWVKLKVCVGIREDGMLWAIGDEGLDEKNLISCIEDCMEDGSTTPYKKMWITLTLPVDREGPFDVIAQCELILKKEGD